MKVASTMKPRLPKQRPDVHLSGSLKALAGILFVLMAFLTLGLHEKIPRYMRYNEEKRDRVSHLKELHVEYSDIEEFYNILSSEHLEKLAKMHSKVYASNTPFPHIYIDGIFPDSFMQKVSLENPESHINSGCVAGASNCFKSRHNEYSKSTIEAEDLMGIYTKILFSGMKSSNFIKFLEDLSGVHNIIPDPHYRGSGLHFTADKGFLDIHADFNRYDKFELDRRVNAFVFLNHDWEDSFQGHLELWDRKLEYCKRISPSFGRLVVFSSTDFSYHGHPVPLESGDRVRRSLALYYYTNGRPASEIESGKHSTLWQHPAECVPVESS